MAPPVFSLLVRRALDKERAFAECHLILLAKRLAKEPNPYRASRHSAKSESFAERHRGTRHNVHRRQLAP
jgi:hypothetical protein